MVEYEPAQPSNYSHADPPAHLMAEDQFPQPKIDSYSTSFWRPLTFAVFGLGAPILALAVYYGPGNLMHATWRGEILLVTYVVATCWLIEVGRACFRPSEYRLPTNWPSSIVAVLVLTVSTCGYAQVGNDVPISVYELSLTKLLSLVAIVLTAIMFGFAIAERVNNWSVPHLGGKSGEQ